MALDAVTVKRKARELGADLVGIAPADVLNAHPPDPSHPQIPTRISPEIRSAIAIAKRIPLGVMISYSSSCSHHLDQLVMRSVDKLGYALAAWIEEEGAYAFPVIVNETDPLLKRGSYGYLSMRHVAIEAGLGTLGLDLNLLTPEYGPRVYLGVVLTTAELEADRRMTEQVCIGETCGRCLYCCPPDSVRQFGLDKRGCRRFAQPNGMNRVRAVGQQLLAAAGAPDRAQVLEQADRHLYAVWQGMLRCVGGFGACPRCLAVCPVGADYECLKNRHREIPERDAGKVERLRDMITARREGREVAGLSPWNVRWVGEHGYHGAKTARSAPGLPSRPAARGARQREAHASDTDGEEGIHGVGNEVIRR